MRRTRASLPALVAVAAAVASLLLAACGAAAAPPTPLPTATPAAVPTATFRPAVPATPAPGATVEPTGTPQAQSVADVQADPAEVEDAFLSNIDDLIAEASDLSLTPCEDLVAVTNQNPNLVPSMRGFAATMKRVSASQPVLDTDAVKSAIADLDKTMGELEGALSLCGISQR